MSLLPNRCSSTPAAPAPQQPAAATNRTPNDADAAVSGLRSTQADRISAFSTGAFDADLDTGAGAAAGRCFHTPPPEILAPV